MLPVLTFILILRRRLAGVLLECGTEITQSSETYLVGYFCKRKVGRFHQNDGLFQPELVDVVVCAHIGNGFELVVE